MGLPSRVPVAVLLGILVIAQLGPGAIGTGECEEELAAGHSPARARAEPPPRSLQVTAAFDALFYLPSATVKISGRVTDQDGDGAATARVAAELWGGPPLGSTLTDATGNYSLAIQAPGTAGNYSVNVTAEKDGLSALTEPILRVIAESNDYPKIHDVSRTPVNATPVDDVLVSANVSDDHGVKEVTLAYLPVEGTFVRVRMNSNGTGAYTSRIPRQPEGFTVNYYIEASDGTLSTYHPPGAPARTASYRVLPAAPAREWVRLVAVLNTTECLVDRHFLVTGYLRNETGGPVGGARLVLTFENSTLPAMEGSTDDRGVFQMEAAAPAIPGNYAVRIACESGGLSNSTSVALFVRDALTVVLHTSRPSVEASGRLAVTGAVRRKDGSAASGASVRVMFEGSRFWWDCKADASGAFNLTVKAPGRSGSYMLNATASFAGINGSAGLRMAVLAPPRATPGGGAASVLGAIALALAAGALARRRPT